MFVSTFAGRVGDATGGALQSLWHPRGARFDGLT